MTENGDPYENALAERMNGIIKNEFDLYNNALTFEQMHKLIVHSVEMYNTVRPHSSCDYLTPVQAHNQNQQLKKRWKSYAKPWQIFAEQRQETIL
jgi:transposase InsO family protein